jgi:hypothetical protein
MATEIIKRKAQGVALSEHEINELKEKLTATQQVFDKKKLNRFCIKVGVHQNTIRNIIRSGMGKRSTVEKIRNGL